MIQREEDHSSNYGFKYVFHYLDNIFVLEVCFHKSEIV